MTNWLNRSLVESPAFYCLCTSEKEYRKVLKRLGVKKDSEWVISNGATMHSFENVQDTKKLCCVVTMDIENKHSMPQFNALLVHEAVHIWQAIRESIGEKFPSSEFEAYSIQRISLELMDELEFQLSKLKVEEPKRLTTDEMVNVMASRFLSWKLPKDFHPDGGIKFDHKYSHDSISYPTGTNLFHYEQAKEMLKFIIGDSNA